MTDLRSQTKVLSDLYSLTGEDWEIEIHHCLTEPTCPSVFIRPEGWSLCRYRFDCSTIEEGVRRAVERVKTEVIDRKVVGHEFPVSNSDDSKFERWLLERAAGSNAELPRND